MIRTPSLSKPAISMTLGDLARLLGAELHEAASSSTSAAATASIQITGLQGMEAATAGQVTFLANPRYASLVASTQASAILIEPSHPPVPLPSLRISNPYYAFARALGFFAPTHLYPPGIHPTAAIAPSATIGANVHIGPFVSIGEDAHVGDNSVLLSHVSIYPCAAIGASCLLHSHSVVREHCALGNHVVLQNGAIIGADGFGFAKDNHGEWFKIPQSAPVTVEDHVEIQAHACIDRASVGETRIHRGAKIDNLVHVGHSCTVGERTLLCAQVGLAGSTQVGKDVILAGQVGVAGHCTIGDGAMATAQSGIHGDIAPKTHVSGSPAIPHRQWMRSSATFATLPDRLRKLTKDRNQGNN